MSIASKNCIRCDTVKSLSAFCNLKERLDGRATECRVCFNKRTRDYKRTKEGLLAHIYSGQRKNSRKRGHPEPSYTLDGLRLWALNQPEFHALFAQWVAYGYKKMLVPSADRLDDYKSYTIDNLQWLTWAENQEKGHSDVRNGINNKRSKAVVQMTLDGQFVAEYHSQLHAERTIGCCSTGISQCCHRKQKTACGFRWMRSLGIPIHNNLTWVKI